MVENGSLTNDTAASVSVSAVFSVPCACGAGACREVRELDLNAFGRERDLEERVEQRSARADGGAECSISP
jgi:hypothetical protein